MNNKILLINPRQDEMHYVKMDVDYYFMYHYPPMGLMYLSAALRQNGFETHLIDATCTPFLASDLLNVIKNDDYLFVGFYSSMATSETVLKYADAVKKNSGLPVVVGGPSSLSGNMPFKDNTVDFLCHGEGEKTIVELARYFTGSFDKKNLCGVTYKDNGTLITAPPQDLIENLDEIPFPDRSKVPVDSYHERYNFNSKEPFTTMLTSRGCPWKCTYCASPAFWGKKVRRRSPDNVIREIETVCQDHGIKYIDFIDDVFTLNAGWVREFCEKLIRSGLKIKWSCISDPKGASYEILSLMKKAGCDTIKIGLQSANPEILINVKRPPESPGQTRKLIRDARDLGFLVYLDFILGMPGETITSLKNNIDFALDSNPTIAKFYKLAILEGSELHRNLGEKHHDLTEADIDKFYNLSWRKFYCRISKALDLCRWLIRNPSKFMLIPRYLKMLA